MSCGSLMTLRVGRCEIIVEDVPDPTHHSHTDGRTTLSLSTGKPSFLCLHHDDDDFVRPFFCFGAAVHSSRKRTDERTYLHAIASISTGLIFFGIGPRRMMHHGRERERERESERARKR
mmetsp:Transcript_32364/g.78958  ORF Transcript_32364/g.78958 Transcript_32364/m.78958 type:complete len:119 (+) Transcript_32364:667-1023(+)